LNSFVDGGLKSHAGKPQISKKLEYVEDFDVLRNKQDFSIKTSVKITSEESLEWMQSISFHPHE
jgi:hypothetical protein